MYNLSRCSSNLTVNVHLYLVRYLNFSTWGRASLTTRSEQRTLFWPRTMASVLEVLILIPAVSYTTVSPRAAGPYTMRPKGSHHLQTTEREYWDYQTEIHPPPGCALKLCPYTLWTELVTKGSPDKTLHRRTIYSVEDGSSPPHCKQCESEAHDILPESPPSRWKVIFCGLTKLLSHLSFQVFVSLTAPYPLVGTRVSALLPPEGKAFSN